MRSVVSALLLLAAATAALAAPAPFAKRERHDRISDEVRIQGEWTRTAAYHRRGGGWVSLNAPPHTFTFVDGQLRVGALIERVTLHPKQSPRGIDFTQNHTPDVER